MKETELKPCPFCGGEANLVKRKFKTGFYPSGGTYDDFFVTESDIDTLVKEMTEA